MRRNYVLIGSPGSGKSTFSDVLKEFEYKAIMVGDIIRSEINIKSKYSDLIISLGNQGLQIPDEIVIKLVSPHLQELSKISFILDSFPLTAMQYSYLVKELDANEIRNKTVFVYIKVSKKNAILRLLGRETCRNCAKVYNTYFKPTKYPNLCDYCNMSLFKRKQDCEEIAIKRVQLFQEETLPILKLAKKDGFEIIEIKTNNSIENCKSQYLQLLTK